MTLSASYVSDAIVELLSELGCRYLPLYPGSSFRGLHDSLVNYRAGSRNAPELVLCTHEEICVAAAHAYAKGTGEVGWAAVHDLVGLMHASMAVYNVWCDDAPVVVLGGGGPLRPSERRPIDWLHSATEQSGLVRPYVKWADDPIDPQGTLDGIAQAWQLAASVPRKPTYVTVDAAVQEQEAPGELHIPTAREFQADLSPACRQEDVQRAAETLWAADAPLIVAGSLGFRREATQLLVDVAERLGAAFCDDRNAVSVPTSHPQSLTGDPGVLNEADFLLAVDVQDLNWLTAGGKNSLGGYRARDSFRGKILDVSARRLAMGTWANAGNAPRPVDARLVGDPLTVLGQLRDAVVELERRAHAGDLQERERRRQTLAARHKKLRDRQAEAAEERWDQQPISVTRMVGELWEAVKGHDWLLLMRNTRSWPEGLWQFDGADQYLGHSGGGGVGYGPGAMLGGALAARARGQLPVSIVGDGDFLAGPGVLWSAKNHGVPMLVVLHNNRSYYNDEEHQRHMARTRNRPIERAHIGVRIHEPDIDYGMMARSQGAWAPDPVSDPKDLRLAFEQAVERVAAGDVAVVDVHTSV